LALFLALVYLMGVPNAINVVANPDRWKGLEVESNRTYLHAAPLVAFAVVTLLWLTFRRRNPDSK